MTPALILMITQAIQLAMMSTTLIGSITELVQRFQSDSEPIEFDDLGIATQQARKQLREAIAKAQAALEAHA